MQFTSITESNFSRGLDSRSAENLIPPGFVEDVLNMRTVNNRLAKRNGYELFGGCLPLRVEAVKYDQSANTIQISFDGIVDLSSKKAIPVVIYGRTNLNSHGGDFNLTDNGEYYDKAFPQTRDTLVAPSGTLTKTQAERPITDDIFATGLAIATNGDQLDNEIVIPDQIRQDKTTQDVHLDYTVSVDTEAFVYFKEKSAVAGEVYVDDAAVIDNTGTLVIPAALHSLNNSNIMTEFFTDTGTEWVKIYPDKVIIDPTTTDLTATFIGLSSTTVRAVLTSIPSIRSVTISVAPNSPFSYTITNADSPYIFVTTYALEGGNLEQVLPDKVTYDPTTRSHTVSGFNGGASLSLTIIYEYGKIAANSFIVNAKNPITQDGIDLKPQMTVWGFCHEADIYGGLKTKREGWVTHLDSYKRAAEERLISGLGGVLYANRERTEVSAAYQIPFLYPSIRSRLSTLAVTLGPAFISPTDTERSSGWIKSTDTTNFKLPVNSITYNSGTGYVDVEISANGLTLSDPTITNIISVDKDIITLENTGNSRFNGEHVIKAISNTASTITVSIQVDSVDSSLWDETDVGGLAGIFTDSLTTDTPSDFLPNDIITDNFQSYTVLAVEGNKIFFKGATDFYTMAGSSRITATRTSRVVQLRDEVGNNKVDKFVPGDAVTITGKDGTFRIDYINVLDTHQVNLVDDGTSLIISNVTSTETLIEGQSIILSRAGVYSGIHVIEKTLSKTSFQVKSVTPGSGTGYLVGKTIEIDAEVVWEDKTDNTILVDVVSRWLPIEFPDDNFSLTPVTRPIYFRDGRINEKPFIRSTLIADNLYFTTENDSIFKFDGTNIYRAGLFRWQPQAFVTLDNSAGTIPTTNVTSGTITDVNGTRFTVPIADQNKFSVGQKVQHSDNLEIYTITSIEEDKSASPPTNLFINVNKKITGNAAGTLTSLQTFHYYFRLNAVDANNNIIASAITGEQDIRVEVGAASAIRLRLIGFPAWDIYDYERLEVEVYRSQADTPIEFRRVTNIGLQFNVGDGYIDVVDTLSDENWSLQPLDPVASALLGAELGTTWSEPIRAKGISSANNRLVLTNIKSYPRMDIRLVNSSDEIALSNLISLIWELKRTNTTTSGTTDMINRVRYEFVDDSSAVSINPATDIVNNGGTSFTISSGSHGLAAGDWVYLYHSSYGTSHKLTYAGWFQINSATVNTFTIKLSHSATYIPSAADVDRYVRATNPKDVPVLLSLDGNLNYISGKSTLPKFIAMQRLGIAINASMRMTDTSIPSQSTFTPWIVANSGGEYAAGQLILTQPKVDEALGTGEAFELVVPNYSNMNIYVNDVLEAPNTEVQAVVYSFPSRMLISYQNHPELFDNPLAQLPEESDSIIDINPSDGQEITASIPFFGDSVFGNAQKGGIHVVFKSNSIYLVNIEQKAQGAKPGLANPIQKIESRGIGCTAPDSVAQTKQGIIFAHDSGLYVLTRQLNVLYIGRPLERLWNNSVNKDKIELLKGHHYSLGNQYKVAVPIGNDTETSQVYVYDHSMAEGPVDGSWLRYDNHNATWWANLGSDAFFSSTNGKVLKIRIHGSESDFRDENQPIKAQATLRALDFGAAGIRKLVSQVLMHFRNEFPQQGTVVEWDTDLTRKWNKLPSFSIDSEDGSVVTVRFDLKRSRGIYFRLRITNKSLDEPLEISGVEWRVGGLSSQGTKEAAEV